MVLGGGLGQSEVRLSSDQETLVDSQYRVTASVSVPAAGLSEILDDHAVATNEVAFVWCDTQGSETEVIASATRLWSSGVPLYAELWPAGLTARVGLEAFYGEVESNFSHFVPRDSLVAAGSKAVAQPISELRYLLDNIASESTFTDALLLPSGWGD